MPFRIAFISEMNDHLTIESDYDFGTIYSSSLVLSEESEETKRLREDIYGIRGITSFTANRFRLGFGKGSLFRWLDLKPKIVHVLEEFIGQRLEIVKHEYQTNRSDRRQDDYDQLPRV